MARTWTSIVMLFLAAAASAQTTGEPRPEDATGVDAPAPYLASEPGAIFRTGVELVERGAFEDAKSIFLSLTVAYPDLPEPYINLGVLLAAEGAAEASAQAIETAIDADPVCRAAFRLEIVEELGAFSRALLGERGGAPVSTVTRPAPAAFAPAPAAAGAVTGMVRAWAEAWSSQRVDDYLAFYAESFRPAGGADRESWATQRRLRLQRPAFVEVSLSNLAVDLPTARRGTVTFTQRFRSDSYSDVVDKTLEVEKVDGAWKIVAERTGG